MEKETRMEDSGKVREIELETRNSGLVSLTGTNLNDDNDDAARES